ncbi:heterokaryon incompatibility protein-domain-containing protein [Nemania sp. FL0031]|nr:heterokaryon incompatibility protein-domain-containing protein [Nemania sp. FL0031]
MISTFEGYVFSAPNQDGSEEDIPNRDDFCKICRSLDFNCPLPVSKDIGRGPRKDTKTDFHRHDSELEASGTAGCRFCSVIHDISLYLREQIDTKKETTVNIKLRANGIIDISIDFNAVRLYAILDSAPAWETLPVAPALDQSLTPFSQHSFQFMRQCIETCLTQHPQCKQEIQTIPSRLLKVGLEGEPAIRLVETQFLHESRYVALSYCWGGEQPTKLMHGNILSMKSHITVAELPKTIQDAIRITRVLKCEYLWIDAFCIIQDDIEDWKVEAAKMGSVYANAYVTLLATASESASSGFAKFNQIFDPFEFGFPWIDGQGNQTTLVARCVMRNDKEHQRYREELMASSGLIMRGHKPTKGPLGDRGWALQENLLSTRILSFTSDEIIWAIAAVAEYIQPILGSKYVAGVWESNLVRDLLWHVFQGRQHAQREFIAPTFSWASVSSGVEDRSYLEGDMTIECHVEETQVLLAGPSDFGQVSEGCFVKLRGKAFLATASISNWPSADKDSELITGGRKFLFYADTILEAFELSDGNGTTETYLCRSLEGSINTSPLANASALLLNLGQYLANARDYYRDDIHEKGLQMFLALGKSPRKPNVYERVGVASVARKDWLTLMNQLVVTEMVITVI